MTLNREDTLAVFIDFQEKLMPAMHHKEELQDKVCRLAKGLGVLGIPHIVTQQYTKGIGETIPEVAEAIGEFEAIDKTTFSCMSHVDFINQLEIAAKKNIIVCGIESHICVQQTVEQLLEEGYNVYIPVDCISSRSQNDFLWAAERMEKAGAIMTTYESILYELLKDSKAEEFREISKIVK
ncbi:MAG: isochorismatase family protein [Clostridiales bacterium]|nr:isochorismatase family protein [Clostridiales bacterium]